MAVTRGDTITIDGDSSASQVDITSSHTVDTNTTLLLVFIGLQANIDILTTPTFDGGDLTLIRESTNSGTSGNMHNYVYAMVNPTVKTADITMTTNTTSHTTLVAINYIGTIVSSPGAAVLFLSEDVNDDPTTTSVIASGGTTGNALLFVGNFRGGDGDPSSNDATFTELADGATGTHTSSDAAYYVADLLDSAPSAITVTWAVEDENAAQYFQIVAAAGGGGSPFPYHSIKQRRNGMKTLLTM